MKFLLCPISLPALVFGVFSDVYIDQLLKSKHDANLVKLIEFYFSHLEDEYGAFTYDASYAHHQ